mmetsp:Transcript_27607/g.73176  ORF Transcript_27607/g.73176 Transcript_27607/m.73176 type:complete len:505 (-) Transcript_27607:84-1598(-)
MDVAVKLQAIQFCFDWIVATLVAVNWCYMFKMSFPATSNTVWAWSLYTIFLLFALPFLKTSVLDRLESDVHNYDKITLQGWRYLLSITCGTAVGTAMTGLVSLTFPNLSSVDFYGIGSPTGFCLAGTVTISFMMLQSSMEWLYHVGLPSYPKNGWLKSVLTILLCSMWSTIGYVWNSVWDKELSIINVYVAGQYAFLLNKTGTSASQQLSRGIMPAVLGQQPTTDQPPAKFQTIDALIYADNDVDGAITAMEWKAYKAAVTTLVAVVILYLIPDLPHDNDRRWLTRRFKLSAQMIPLTVAAYATTDCGYDFGTDYVTALTGSSTWGLVAAYAYAVLVSCIVCTISCVFRFRTRTQFQKWLFLLGCYDVSFAWWYVWQETLYQIQGYGLSMIDGHWYTDWVDFSIAMLQNFLMTLLWVVCVRHVSRFAVENAIRKAEKRGTHDDELDLQGVLNAGSITDSFRFLAACSGLDLDSVDALRKDSEPKYGADALGGGGADLACEGGGA